jgi:hypothetical protein
LLFKYFYNSVCRTTTWEPRLNYIDHGKTMKHMIIETETKWNTNIFSRNHQSSFWWSYAQTQTGCCSLNITGSVCKTTTWEPQPNYIDHEKTMKDMIIDTETKWNTRDRVYSRYVKSEFSREGWFVSWSRQFWTCEYNKSTLTNFF